VHGLQIALGIPPALVSILEEYHDRCCPHKNEKMAQLQGRTDHDTIGDPVNVAGRFESAQLRNQTSKSL